MSNAKKTAILGILFSLPPFMMIIAIVAYPILQSVILSFQDRDGSFTLEHYQHILTHPVWQANILYTFNVVIWTTVLTGIISYAFAMYLVYSKSKISAVLNRLYLIPRFIPGIVAVFAMMSFVRDTGAINRFFMQFGVDLRLNLMHTAPGLIVTNLWFNIPFATMLIIAGLSDIPESVLESARDVGAGKLRVFINMILPLSFRSAAIAVTFVFMGNIGSFMTPFLMGANHPRMLGVALFTEFRQLMRIHTTAALSVLMFLMASIVGMAYIYTSLKEAEWEK